MINTQVYFAISKLQKYEVLYLQHFYFLLFKYYQEARMLDYTRPEKLVSDQHSNLLGTFSCCDENEGL